jgi:glyoxylase-like metal-dependent hydrolase (beta-lactamase superfamily II)
MGTPMLHVVGRRWLLTTAGKGVLGFALLGMAACDEDESSGSASPADAETGTSPTPEASDTAEPSPAEEAAAGELTWSRVDLGFVSAYVLVRGNEAAVVDTGVGGSGEAIGTILHEAGPGWPGVRHVVLTHKHPDHAGSVSEVLDLAPDATGYVGQADLGEVDASRSLAALSDGDEVFGLQIVGTPGHTAGHMAVFDPDTAVLVAGDALTNQNGLAGSNPQFTEDEQAAAESVRTMADLSPKVILVGHGAPVTRGAAAQLRQLASS